MQRFHSFLYIRIHTFIFQYPEERMKKRMFYLVSFVTILCVEILIAIYVHDSFIRPYLGDTLVILLVYSFIRIFIPNGISALPFYVFLFACFIEAMQYFRLVDTLGITNRVARIALGSTFDWKDIVCYGAGCIIIILLERVLLRE